MTLKIINNISKQHTG